MLRLATVALLLSVIAPGQTHPGIVVFSADRTTAMLRQCSRATPQAGPVYWRPTAGGIARMEKAVGVAVAGMAKQRPGELDGFPSKFGRQYVGYVRDGHHYIYGNFGPSFILEEEGDSWKQHPFAVCDGGVGLFGAEFDVDTGKITHLSFNGYG
jgi:hypothetical protein